jgi:hypothetical protein
VARMVLRAGIGETKNVCRISVGERELYRLLGIWKAMLKMCIKHEAVEWVHLAQVRDHLWARLNTLVNLRIT